MEKWFYNGTYMPDGKPITVAAYNEIQERDYRKKGFLAVDEVPAPEAPAKQEEKIEDEKPRAPYVRGKKSKEA